jgi:hypothetical protein
MGFRTKLDFSNNRQVKQRATSSTSLSGGTIFGLPYDMIPKSPDLDAVISSGPFTANTSTFSGNTATTVYSWSESKFSIGEYQLSAITPSNSATTQTVVDAFGVNTTGTTVDGYVYATSYSGVSYDLTPLTFNDLGGGNYSGTVETDNIFNLVAGSLDYTGRTIWATVSGITQTEDLIITRTPQTGYVFTCVNAEGKGAWQPFAAVSGNSSMWSASTGSDSLVIKNWGSTASDTNSISVGFQCNSYAPWSYTEGYQTSATTFSHAEGFTTLASGDASHSEGFNTISSGQGSHSEGYQTQSLSQGSHSEGVNTVASQSASHAEGFGTIANGNYTHSEGFNTIASGDKSHAQGDTTQAIGNSAHAEGYQTLANGNFSHAEGYITKANGDYSHAEGNNAIANGQTSHAEGFNTRANGVQSHAQGQETIAGGSNSHAGGTGSIASGITSFIHSTNSLVLGNRSVVLGGQNITGTTADYVYVPSLNIKTVGSGAFVNELRIDATGNLTTNTSDGRLKKNITRISDALNKINRLQGVSYQWNDIDKGGEKVRLGFIAQQVQSVEPDLVFTNKEDGYLGITSDGFIPLIVESIKELTRFVGYNKPKELIFDYGGLKPLTEEEIKQIEEEEARVKEEQALVLEKETEEERRIREEDEKRRKEEEGLLYLNKYKIPFYTPESSGDEKGEIDSMTYDIEYLYIKTLKGWKRTNLENF